MPLNGLVQFPLVSRMFSLSSGFLLEFSCISNYLKQNCTVYICYPCLQEDLFGPCRTNTDVICYMFVVTEDTSIPVRNVRCCCNSPCLDWSVLSDLSTQFECFDKIASVLGDAVSQVRKNPCTIVSMRFGAVERTGSIPVSLNNF